MRLKKSHIVFVLFGMFLFGSCQKNDCIQKSKVKPKKYRLKKMKAYQRGVGGGTATTVGADEELRAKKEAEAIAKAKEEEVKSEPTQSTRPEEEIVSIPDTKFGGPPPPKEEKKIEFNEQEIDLSEGEYVYEQEISFVNETDLFTNQEEAREQVKELAKLLKKNEDIHVTIVGNTASRVPDSGSIYGDSAEVLNQKIKFNTRDATIKDAMIARAKKVYNLLIDSGVNPEQLDYKTGSHRRYKRERVVSFILK